MDSKSYKQMQEPRSLQSLAENKIDSFGNNLYHQFVLRNSTSSNASYIGGVLRSLSGVPVNARNKEGYTALHLAIKKQDYLMAEKLLSVVRTIDVNVKSSHGGKTALHMAVDIGVDTKDVIDLVERLIIKGAVVNAEDRDGKTPLYVSVEKKSLGLVKVLVQLGAIRRKPNCDSPLHLAVKQGSSEIVKILIENHYDVNYLDKHGDTPLHIASKEGCVGTVEFLVEKGARTYFRNHDGNTALHVAVEKGMVAIVKILLENGACVHCKNNRGCTPLHVLARKGIIM